MEIVTDSDKIKQHIPIIIFILGSIFLGYLLLYLPISRQLNDALIENWRLSAQAKGYSLNLAIQQQIEGGASISSRSAIREKIIEYEDGKIGWDGLKVFTEEKYNDGVLVLNHLVFSYREIDKKILVQYIVPGQEKIFNQLEPVSQDLQHNQIFEIDGKTYFFVKSGIKAENILLGYDFICYDLSSVIADLNSEGETLEILPASVFMGENQNGLEKNFASQGAGKISYSEELVGADAYLKIETSSDLILEYTKKITNINLFLYILILILLFVLSILLYLRRSRHEIRKIESRKNDYEKLAYQDALTGAYSRQFLVNWIEHNSEACRKGNNQCVIVLMDVDHLKAINDNHGHNIGDQVLKSVVLAAKKILRKSDLIIRYGGDEFLIIFNDIEESSVSSIMQRIESELTKIDLLSIKISFSYGVSSIQDIDSLEQGIKQADSNMYTEKRKKLPIDGDF